MYLKIRGMDEKFLGGELNRPYPMDTWITGTLADIFIFVHA